MAAKPKGRPKGWQGQAYGMSPTPQANKPCGGKGIVRMCSSTNSCHRSTFKPPPPNVATDTLLPFLFSSMMAMLMMMVVMVLMLVMLLLVVTMVAMLVTMTMTMT